MKRRRRKDPKERIARIEVVVIGQRTPNDTLARGIDRLRRWWVSRTHTSPSDRGRKAMNAKCNGTSE